MQIAIVEKLQKMGFGIDQMFKLIQWQAVQKWDGKLPSVTSGATPFIQVK